MKTIDEKLMEFYTFLSGEYDKEPLEEGNAPLIHLARKDQTAKIKLKFIDLFLKE